MSVAHAQDVIDVFVTLVASGSQPQTMCKQTRYHSPTCVGTRWDYKNDYTVHPEFKMGLDGCLWHLLGCDIYICKTVITSSNLVVASPILNSREASGLFVGRPQEADCKPNANITLRADCPVSAQQPAVRSAERDCTCPA